MLPTPRSHSTSLKKFISILETEKPKHRDGKWFGHKVTQSISSSSSLLPIHWDIIHWDTRSRGKRWGLVGSFSWIFPYSPPTSTAGHGDTQHIMEDEQKTRQIWSWKPESLLIPLLHPAAYNHKPSKEKTKYFQLQASLFRSSQGAVESNKTLMAPSGSIQKEWKRYQSSIVLMWSLKTNCSNHT